jgi:carotenoid 1,2-hydratase
VFSPWYFAARRRGAADPENHVALNVALYGVGGKRWAFTERRRAALTRNATRLAIGPSAVAWEGDSLVIRIMERTCPWPGRISGTVRLHPAALARHGVTLDAAALHRWSPIAPCARVEVALDQPALRWAGEGYLDHNAGDEPIEHGFRQWHWSRAATRHGTVVLYDVTRRDGSTHSLSLCCQASGAIQPIAPPPAQALPRTGWRVARATRADGPARVVSAFEDAPFYARTLLETRLLGGTAMAVHESLDLDRFRRPIVQWMLPFKAPRVLR